MALLTGEPRIKGGNLRLQDFEPNDEVQKAKSPVFRLGFLPESTGRSERIRTFDPLIPNQMRYQAALRSAEPCILAALLPCGQSQHAAATTGAKQAGSRRALSCPSKAVTGGVMGRIGAHRGGERPPLTHEPQEATTWI